MVESPCKSKSSISLLSFCSVFAIEEYSSRLAKLHIPVSAPKSWTLTFRLTHLCLTSLHLARYVAHLEFRHEYMGLILVTSAYGTKSSSHTLFTHVAVLDISYLLSMSFSSILSPSSPILSGYRLSLLQSSLQYLPCRFLSFTTKHSCSWSSKGSH